mgnify:CR=1 FL=1
MMFVRSGGIKVEGWYLEEVSSVVQLCQLFKEYRYAWFQDGNERDGMMKKKEHLLNQSVSWEAVLKIGMEKI